MAQSMTFCACVGVVLDDLYIGFTIVTQFFVQPMALMAVVQQLDGLLETDGDEQTEDDGGDVDEEFTPTGGGMVGGMNVEHGDGFLGLSL